VDHQDRARRRSAALGIGLLALLSATALSGAAFAGGMPAAANALTSDAGRKAPTSSVSVDYSALDAAAPALLVPQNADANGPIVLHPPAGVAPIKLKPPVGVKPRPAARPAAPKEKAALPETKTAGLPPSTTVPSTTPNPPQAKPAPVPAASAPPAPKAVSAPTTPAAAPPKAAASVTPPPAAPKQTTPPPAAPKQVTTAPAPTPAPVPASTTVATAQQPRSLLTPPPSSAPAAAAPTASAAAPAAEPKAEETKVASLPPAAAAKSANEADTLRIAFGIGGADLPATAATDVKSLAQRLAKDPALRVQLVAYASDPDKSISRSRRLSLERAVAVRKVLLAAGVESTRIDLRALGEQSGGGPPDRVDAITTRR